MFWSVCACAGPGQLKAAARAGVAGGRCSESESVVVPGVGPRKPAAALRRSRATAALLPLLLLLLLLRLSLNDGLVLNCPPRGAEQSQHQHRTTAAVLLLWNLLSTARTAILQLARHRYTVKDSAPWAQLCHCRRSHQEASEIIHNLGHLKPFSSGRII